MHLIWATVGLGTAPNGKLTEGTCAGTVPSGSELEESRG